MAGVSPGRVPVHTALKKSSQAPTAEPPQFYCTVSTITGTVQSCWRQCVSALSGPCAPVEPVSTAQQGRRPPHVQQLEESLWSSTCKTIDDMKPPAVWNCTHCTTGTKSTLSNCNCEISMARAMGDQPTLRKDGGVNDRRRTATAELRHLSLTNDGHIINLVRELHLEHEELDNGELPLRHNRNVRTKSGTCRCTTKCEQPCPGTASVESPVTSTVSTVRFCLCCHRNVHLDDGLRLWHL